MKRWADRLIVAGLAAFGLAAIVGTVRHFGGIVALGGAAPAAGGAAAAGAGFWLIWRLARLPARFVVPAAMLIAFGLRAVWIATVPTAPVSDFRTMAEAARAVAGGDVGPLRSEYFQLWTYQVPFVLGEAALFRLFGPDLAVLKWANAVVLALLPAVGYALGRSAAGGGRSFGAGQTRRAGGAPAAPPADGTAEAGAPEPGPRDDGVDAPEVGGTDPGPRHGAVGAAAAGGTDPGPRRGAVGAAGAGATEAEPRDGAAEAEAAETAGKLAALLLAVYPSTVMMASVLTNQHLAALLAYGGLFVWGRALRRLSGGKGGRALLLAGAAGALLAAGDLVRPIGIVFVAAAVTGALLFAGERPRLSGKEGRARFGFFGRLGLALGLVAVFFAGRTAVSVVLVTTGVTDRPLGNHEPLWKFVAGLNRETIGHFSRADYEAVMGLPAGDDRTAFERALIAERLRAPGLGAFFMEKAAYLWGFPDQAPIWSGWAPPKPVLAAALAFERVLFLLAVLGLSAFGRLRRPEIGPGAAVLALFLLGYAAAHLVIEIQVRYRYDALPALLALGAVGWTKRRRK
ncbi:MAG: hypothetical protein KM312_13090 [Hydrogenibacillus schlegelii]|uniref:Glycosyltransferase RgtA/B/C/D-like domain-containing protein n=1 Tax=Hydrogenibacillus schlegelii TaxID=1484 RepID=A0A947D6C5_HYDSH|nr:hypothetical protein [Hydrogenibacillus schlegelii]